MVVDHTVVKVIPGSAAPLSENIAAWEGWQFNAGSVNTITIS
jgi:hypothetical protein